MYKIVLLFTAALAATHGGKIANLTRLAAPSFYTLYTNENPHNGRTFILSNEESISSLPMAATNNCAIIVHGVGGSGSSTMSTILRDAFLTSETTNVIIVDWEVAASSILAANYARGVADNVIELVRLLTVHNKINRASLHLVGFGLAAHIVGFAARQYVNDSPVARITGLNPELSSEWQTDYLRRTDAIYVEGIHTRGNMNVGHADFYPHGARDQPGCSDIPCHENRAYELFAASLTDGGLTGYRCDNVAAATGTRPCTGFTLALGTNALIKYGSGNFRLETNAVFPYRSLVRSGVLDEIIEIILEIYKNLPIYFKIWQ